MEPNFEIKPELKRLAAQHRRARVEIDASHRDEPKASEVLANNQDVPFSMRLGAQERKLLMALARKSGKSMSQLARELLVEGLMRLESDQQDPKPAGDATDLTGLLDNIRKLTMLARSVEATAERVARRQA